MLHLNFNILVVIFISFVQSSCAGILGNWKQDDGRIVGGKETTIDQRPYTVSIARNGRHTCGGSIIRENVIVTAAHCLPGATANALTIRAGSTVTNSGGQVIQVQKIISHPKYNRYNLENDIGLLILKETLIFDKFVAKIDLPAQNEPISDETKGRISGWGLLNENTRWSPSIRLNTVEVPVVSHFLCNFFYWNSINDKLMFCAGDFNRGGKDSCQGDSGGPYEVSNKLFGVISWGYGCAKQNYPGVYTRVPSFRDWIDTTLATENIA